jgi:hypothetical protein
VMAWGWPASADQARRALNSVESVGDLFRPPAALLHGLVLDQVREWPRGRPRPACQTRLLVAGKTAAGFVPDKDTVRCERVAGAADERRAAHRDALNEVRSQRRH